MKNLFALLICLLLLAGVATAQLNFIKNGDFSLGTNGMQFWTGSGQGANPLTGIGHTTNPVTEKFDTNGGGLSPAFTILPGGNTNQNPNNPPYILQQQKVMIVPAPMEMHMDVCLTGPNGNAQGGHLKIKIAGQQVAAWSEYQGSFTAGTYRRHLTLTFTPTPAQAGPQNVEIEFWREKYIWSWGSASSHTPKMAIDNIVLTSAMKPVLIAKGERKLGSSLTLELQGNSGAAGIYLMGFSAGPSIALPGFTGAFQIGLTGGLYLFGNGVFNTGGILPLSLPLPNDPALAGAPLFFQGLQMGTTGNHLSHMHKLPIYN